MSQREGSTMMSLTVLPAAQSRGHRGSSHGLFTPSRVFGAWQRALLLAIAMAAFAPSASLASNEVYTYDNAGRLVTVDHGDGKTTTYTLDAAGNRTNLS